MNSVSFHFKFLFLNINLWLPNPQTENSVSNGIFLAWKEKELKTGATISRIKW